MEDNNLKCELCKTGKMHRHHVCEDYVVWMCDNGDCPQQDLEEFGDLDDEGWKWLRDFYKRT